MPIATYMFIDVGAPGLLRDNPRPITSLSMLAVKSEDLRNITNVNREDNITNPPIQHERYFHLDNAEFDAQYRIIEFLNPLTKPVCLVAYSAFNYDFPLIKSFLTRAGLPFVQDISCADSLAAFYDILRPEDEKSSRAERLAGQFPWPSRAYFNRPRFNLESVYERVLADTQYYINGGHEYLNTTDFRNKAALRIAVKLSDQFPDWLENNYFTFADVPLPVRNH